MKCATGYPVNNNSTWFLSAQSKDNVPLLWLWRKVLPRIIPNIASLVHLYPWLERGSMQATSLFKEPTRLLLWRHSKDWNLGPQGSVIQNTDRSSKATPQTPASFMR